MGVMTCWGAAAGGPVGSETTASGSWSRNNSCDRNNSSIVFPQLILSNLILSFQKDSHYEAELLNCVQFKCYFRNYILDLVHEQDQIGNSIFAENTLIFIKIQIFQDVSI